jgi:hypothetical protein
MLKSMKQWKLLNSDRFHKVIRWALGVHGAIHFAEMCINIYENAWISAMLTALSGSIMISGALLDISHHQGEEDEKYN